jgi:DNA-binding IclR family transcriptional regulator
MGSVARANNIARITRALRQYDIANVAEIAEATALSPATVRRWLDTMIMGGRVERVPGPGRARQYRIPVASAACESSTSTAQVGPADDCASAGSGSTTA